MAAEFWSGGIYRSAIAATLTVSALTVAPAAHAERYAAIVVDADTGEVLHARHEDEPRFPASLTKVMTLYLLFDAIDSGEVTLTDRMPVSRTAAAQPPSNLRLRAGDRMRVEDAIYALVTKSANDVAVVVAEYLAGSERAFADRMTTKARDLGLMNTTFRNASGLPNSAQISTARDMAILADALMTNHPHHYHYFQNQHFSWGGTTYRNHNELVRTVDGVDGIKTGYTRASGFNLMTSAERDGRRVIAVMLGGQTARSRNAHVTDLVETAFATLNQSPELIDPARKPMMFAAIQTPLNPNAAAEPMLNGKPLSAILAQQSGSSVGQPLIELTEGDAADPSPAAPGIEMEAPVAVTPEAEAAPAAQAAEQPAATAEALADYSVADSLTLNEAPKADTPAYTPAPEQIVPEPVTRMAAIPTLILPEPVAPEPAQAEPVQAEPAPAEPAAPEPPVFEGFSVAEYEASQAARAAANARSTAAPNRQLRRR